MSECHWSHNFSVELPSPLLSKGRVGNVPSSIHGIFPFLSTIMCLVTGPPYTLMCARHVFSPKSLCFYWEYCLTSQSCPTLVLTPSQGNSNCSSMNLLPSIIHRNFLYPDTSLPVSYLLLIYDLLILILNIFTGSQEEKEIYAHGQSPIFKQRLS